LEEVEESDSSKHRHQFEGFDKHKDSIIWNVGGISSVEEASHPDHGEDFIGKLKVFCPCFFHSLTKLEKDTLKISKFFSFTSSKSL